MLRRQRIYPCSQYVPLLLLRRSPHRFFFSSTIILTLDIPDGQLGLPGVCADVGAFFGIVIATLILVKLKPQARVVLNGITQVCRRRYGTGAHSHVNLFLPYIHSHGSSLFDNIYILCRL